MSIDTDALTPCVTRSSATMVLTVQDQVDGLVQERRNSTALAMELHLSCTNPSKYSLPSMRKHFNYQCYFSV